MPAKTLLPALIILGLTAAPALAADVTVKIHDVASAKGRIMVALCKEAEFLKPCGLNMSAKANRGVVSVTFRKVAPGRYAGMVFHDENGNGKMDRTKIGAPAEGAAFSRDAVGYQGPPKFADAAVDVPARGASVDINLVYY